MTALEKRFVNSPQHGRRVAQRAEQLVRLVNPAPRQSLLDVGCGNGDATIHLAATFGLDATGVDLDPDQIATATATSTGSATARFLVADATRLPFADSEFDFAHTAKTTHHIPDWRQALAEMTRVLKPGGHLIYSDFVALWGTRLPTRRAFDDFVREQRLEAVLRKRALVTQTAILRKAE